MKGILWILSLAVPFFSCHNLDERFTLVNSSKRTITFYIARSVPVSNRKLFERFKGEDIADTSPVVYVRIKPGTLFYDFGYPRFASQFKTRDSLLHLLIIDVDSVSAMCKKTSPDSAIIKSIVLENFKYSKSQLEGRGRTIVYYEK